MMPTNYFNANDEDTTIEYQARGIGTRVAQVVKRSASKTSKLETDRSELVQQTCGPC